ncbi:MAG: DNA adenine methylase [Cytophagales bacterium]|nr:DNA adenine methylase [Cytophagales bacterium]
MCKHILPLIPNHELYCEPFFGGGAVFFAKPISRIEIINDTNGEAINFYQVLKNNFKGLNRLVQQTLHSRKLYLDALVMYRHPHLFTKTKRAWAFWILTNQGFATKIGTWGYDKSSGSVENKVMNAKKRFTTDYTDRLEKVQIECRDAIEVIKSRDREGAFFYLDPPYFNSNCGHYEGYKEADFKRLLDTLTTVKGLFMLSSYPSDLLTEYVNDYGWKQRNFTKSIGVTKYTSKRKIEMISSNYDLLA